MQTTRPLLILLLTIHATAAAGAAQGAWSAQCDQPGFGIGGRVFHLGTYRNELVAGLYKTPWRDGALLAHLARFDGVRWQPFGSGVSGEVRATLEFQGSLYVGGRFTTAGGQPATNIARWDGSAWQSVGAGFDNRVWALAEHKGQLYAAGEFTTSGATPVSRLAVWTGTGWQAVGGGLQWNLGVDAAVYGLLSDGNQLFVGGMFDRAGAIPASHVAAWDGTTWRALGGGVNNFGYGWVRALAFHGGRLVVGGVFGQAGAVSADNVAAWDGTQWSPLAAGVQGQIYGASVWALRAFQGDLYIGGAFALSGATPLYGIARFDGTTMHSPGGVTLAEFNPPTVMAMALWNGRLYCGGEFQVAGPLVPPDLGRAVFHVAAYDGAGWECVGRGLGFGDEVHVLGRYQGDVIAAGRFHTAGGRYVAGIARCDGDEWRLFGTFDGLIRGMTLHNGELWVAGEFYTVDGLVADGVARFDGSAWHAVGGGPGPQRANSIASYMGMIHIGTTGSPLRWNGASWQTFTPPIFGTLTQMLVHNGLLYMGGATPFHPGAPNLFAWDGVTLSVPGGGLNGSVEALGAFQGNLVVGGRFTQAGTLPARCIASWDGSAWSTFGSGIRGTTVMEITTFQGQLVVGGDFSRFQGEVTDYVARWSGSAWQAIGPSAPNGAVFALLADDLRGELHVGGWYSKNGNQDDSYYSLWQSTPAWTTVGSGLGTPRRTPALRGEGLLLPGSRASWRLSSARENAPAVLALGAQRIDQPLLGGVLVPRPDVVVPLPTDGIGTATLQVTWQGWAGVQVYAQAWTLDPAAPQGVSASDGLWLRSR